MKHPLVATAPWELCRSRRKVQNPKLCELKPEDSQSPTSESSHA